MLSHIGRFFWPTIPVIFIAFVCIPYTASATHLGPIVFGVERTERVVFCSKLADAKTFANQEQESVQAGESPQQFIERIRGLFVEEKCAVANLTYIAEKTLMQWTGWKALNGEITQGRLSLIQVDLEGEEAYVILPDEAPAPGQ